MRAHIHDARIHEVKKDMLLTNSRYHWCYQVHIEDWINLMN